MRVDDPSISRRHAKLSLLNDDPNPLRIEDLGSSNGTIVRGQPIAPGESHRLAVGETADIGELVLVVQRPTGIDRGRRLWGDSDFEPRLEGEDAPPPMSDDHIIVRDETMLGLYRLVTKIAPTEIPVLIVGETGVGKEVLAEAVHARSKRTAQPFVRVNCAALASSLLESELFGHTAGAFTGATRDRTGFIERANGGTLLLDEIGELPLETQAKLLRVIEEQLVLRVGSTDPAPIDVRFVAATNRDLERGISEGTFRNDLYYRLTGFVLEIPPLRARPTEILPLAQVLATTIADGPTRFSSAAAELLQTYPWPGNVRELRNIVRRAAVLADGQQIDVEHLPAQQMRARLVEHCTPAPTALRRVSGYAQVWDNAADQFLSADERDERARIVAALEACIGNQTRAAQRLGISRRRLITRIEYFGLPRPRKK